MNKLEYIESLIAQGANSNEVFEKARQYDIDNPVKTYDTQNQDATAVNERQRIQHGITIGRWFIGFTTNR